MSVIDRAPGFVGRHGFLRVAGSRVVGRHGQPVVLRGMSLFWSQWQPQYFNHAALQWLRDDWKINVIRAPLAIHSQGYLDSPSTELAKIEGVIEAAIALDIYVIVDWHAHEPEPGPARAFFARLARKYGAIPNLIYEPWNEPASRHAWQDIRAYHAGIADAIRAESPGLIVAGTPNWCHDVDIAANDPLPHRDVAYALHFYAASHQQALRDKAERALRMGCALMVTEWGTCHADGNGPLDYREVRAWWRFLEKHQTGYLNWSICDRDETSAALKMGASPHGAWAAEDLTDSGRIVRRHLRAQSREPGAIRTALSAILKKKPEHDTATAE